jgi:hypothetical protein
MCHVQSYSCSVQALHVQVETVTFSDASPVDSLVSPEEPLVARPAKAAVSTCRPASF